MQHHLNTRNRTVQQQKGVQQMKNKVRKRQEIYVVNKKYIKQNAEARSCFIRRNKLKRFADYDGTEQQYNRMECAVNRQEMKMKKKWKKMKKTWNDSLITMDQDIYKMEGAVKGREKKTEMQDLMEKESLETAVWSRGRKSDGCTTQRAVVQ